jgi:F-type H+-transporting ATPase subunit alpha
VDVTKVVAFEAALHDYVNSSQAELVAKVNAEAGYDDDIANAFHEALKDFKANHTW